MAANLCAFLAVNPPSNLTVLCTDTCPDYPLWTSDGDCDDGGPGAEYAGCDYGTDCTDCGPRPPQPPFPPRPPWLPGTVCVENCIWPSDGECDDGGPGAEWSDCGYGTDCSDCGLRQGQPPRAPTPLRPKPPPSPPSSFYLCTDWCYWFNNGYCDDGGVGAEYDVCDYGTDCTDCGVREPAPSPPPMPPNSCPAGQLQCIGYCLAPIPSSQCPSNANLPRCYAVPHPGYGPTPTYCEGDGECGTNQLLNNCNPGQWDVYQVFVMRQPPSIPYPPSPPPLPPLPPHPPRPRPPPPPTPMPPNYCPQGQIQCYQSCLTPLAHADPSCPADSDLPRCDDDEIWNLAYAVPGAVTFCEGDGECGTNQLLNNCDPGQGDWDVYLVQIMAAPPRSPPRPPPPLTAPPYPPFRPPPPPRPPYPPSLPSPFPYPPAPPRPPAPPQPPPPPPLSPPRPPFSPPRRPPSLPPPSPSPPPPSPPPPSPSPLPPHPSPPPQPPPLPPSPPPSPPHRSPRPATPPHPSEWHSPPRPVLYYPAPPQLHLALELQSSYQPQVTLSVLLLSTLITC